MLSGGRGGGGGATGADALLNIELVASIIGTKISSCIIFLSRKVDGGRFCNDLCRCDQCSVCLPC